MSLTETLTQKTHQQFIKTISDQHYSMPGVVIAASATQAVALGEACMQISFDNQVDRLDWQDVTARIEQMVHIKESLLAWVDQNADVAAKHGNLVDAGQQPPDARVFFEGPAELARLSLLAVNTLTDFQPLAFQQLQENIRITAELLLGCARAAVVLLESRLHRWPKAMLYAEYEPVLGGLKLQLERLTGFEPA